MLTRLVEHGRVRERLQVGLVFHLLVVEGLALGARFYLVDSILIGIARAKSLCSVLVIMARIFRVHINFVAPILARLFGLAQVNL